MSNTSTMPQKHSGFYKIEVDYDNQPTKVYQVKKRPCKTFKGLYNQMERVVAVTLIQLRNIPHKRFTVSPMYSK